MVNKSGQIKKLKIPKMTFFNKKAQMKIQQMAFMLIAVTLFFAIVGMLILVIRSAGLKGEANVLLEENARLLVTKLSNSPEFSCGEAFGTKKTNCIDGDKAILLSNDLENYEDFWGDLNIEIRVIYPAQKREIDDYLCDIDNYPDCNFIQLGKGDVSGDFSNFVALCRKVRNDDLIENKCELAKVFVNYEEIR